MGVHYSNSIGNYLIYMVLTTPMSNTITKPLLATFIAATLFAGLGILGTIKDSFAQQVTLNGAGATFPFPLIDTWRVEYQTVKQEVSINYQSIDSGLTLPAEDIVVVHRSDGSGTTFVWTDYLSNVSSGSNQQIGKGKSVQWPVGVGAPGNEGVANSINTTPNAIGYVELAYAITTGMKHAEIQNQAGNFIPASINSTKAAVASAASSLPAGDQPWTNVTMVNAPGADSYPIASFSYLLLYKELTTNPSLNDQNKAQNLVDFINWAVTDGQQFGPDLGYVPLPDPVVQNVEETLGGLTFNGAPLQTS